MRQQCVGEFESMGIGKGAAVCLDVVWSDATACVAPLGGVVDAGLAPVNACSSAFSVPGLVLKRDDGAGTTSA